MATLLAGAPAAAFDTTMQYSTVAPGIIFGLVVPLSGSETIRLCLVTVRTGAETV